MTGLWPASDNTSSLEKTFNRKWSQTHRGQKVPVDCHICVLLTSIPKDKDLLSQECTMTAKTRVMHKIPTGVWKIQTIKLQTYRASKSNFNQWQDNKTVHKSESSSGSCNMKTTEQQDGFCSISRVYVFMWFWEAVNGSVADLLRGSSKT